MASTYTSGSYAFATEPHRRLLRITFSGFFRAEDLAGYVTAKDAAIKRLQCPPNAHVTLCDFSTCVPQSQAVLDLFRKSLADPRFQSRRIAIVVNTALGTLQAQRIVTRPNAAFFQSIAEAEQWLFAGPT